MDNDKFEDSLPWRSHVLTVGGTGMLRSATLALAKRTKRITIISRDPHKFASEVNSLTGNVNDASIDYHDTLKLSNAVEHWQDVAGPIDLAVCWIHSSAPNALAAIAASLRGPAEIFQVIGSATGNPLDRARQWASTISGFSQVRHRCAILGSVATPSGPRWLSNEEISQGVLKGVVGPGPVHLVGAIHPPNRCPP
ncbi:NADPH:quinone reductase-like Zn-dependent oxidoreductase [Bradyrhizobium diazoefficiens]